MFEKKLNIISYPYVDNLEMTYSQLVDLAAKWNEGGDKITADSPSEITIFDIEDKTAFVIENHIIIGRFQ